LLWGFLPRDSFNLDEIAVISKALLLVDTFQKVLPVSKEVSRRLVRQIRRESAPGDEGVSPRIKPFQKDLQFLIHSRIWVVFKIGFVVSAVELVVLPVFTLAFRRAISGDVAASAGAQLRVAGLVATIAAVVGTCVKFH
jgi:hypothetical protein